MTLFMNHDQHPKMYQNFKHARADNQERYEVDSFSKLVNEQKRAYEEMKRLFFDMENKEEKRQQLEMIRCQDIAFRLNEVKEKVATAEEGEKRVKGSLEKMYAQLSKLQASIEKENGVKKEFGDELQLLSQSYQEIVHKLVQLDKKLDVQKETQENVSKKMDEQLVEQERLAKKIDEKLLSQDYITSKVEEHLNLQAQISEKMDKHENVQSKLLQRVSNQEALTDKMLRQIDYLRSVLFERTHDVTEKMENGFKMISSTLYQLFNGKEHLPYTSFIMNDKKEEKQEINKKI